MIKLQNEKQTPLQWLTPRKYIQICTYYLHIYAQAVILKISKKHNYFNRTYILLISYSKVKYFSENID